MSRRSQLAALLISPDRTIAEHFRGPGGRARAFDIVGSVDSYPTAHALETKLRQLRPDVLLVDVATDLDTAGGLIRLATSLKPPVHVIGLHTVNDSQAILKSLRYGASEFLYAPFEVSIQEAASARIARLLDPAGTSDQERGRVVVFCSSKPGSGASTLAIQTAYALRRSSGRRVLLADFDLTCGTLGFFLGIEHRYSIADLLRHTGTIDAELWSDVTVDADGIDVLTGPDLPYTDPLDGTRLHQMIEYGRSTYPWVVIDLPNVFHKLSLLCVQESDRAFLVSTAELASLHLTRRAVKLLNHLAVDSGKYQVLVNRLESRTELNSSDLSKLFECPVDKGLPNDRLELQRVLTLGKPLDEGSELGRAVQGLATKLVGALPEPARSPNLSTTRPALSQI